MVRLDTPSARNSRAGFRPRSPKTVGRSSWERRAPFSAQQKACYIAYADPGHYTLARIEGRQTHHHAACRTQPLMATIHQQDHGIFGMARQYVAGGASRGVPPMRAILDKGSLPINEKKPLLCVYRRGSTLVFKMAGYTIHFGYGILLIDAGLREAESIPSPCHKSPTARH